MIVQPPQSTPAPSRRRRLLGAALVIALLGACGSTPPSRYYMLSADAVGSPTDNGISIGVGPITIPDYLKGRNMVLARDDHLLTVSEFDRWAEPLEAGINRVLILNLASLSNTQQVYAFPWRQDSTPDYTVRVGVIQFAVGDSTAVLKASWTVQKPGAEGLVHRGLSSLETPASNTDPATVADVCSALLLELSREISAVIASDLAQG